MASRQAYDLRTWAGMKGFLRSIRFLVRHFSRARLTKWRNFEWRLAKEDTKGHILSRTNRRISQLESDVMLLTSANKRLTRKIENQRNPDDYPTDQKRRDG